MTNRGLLKRIERLEAEAVNPADSGPLALYRRCKAVCLDADVWKEALAQTEEDFDESDPFGPESCWAPNEVPVGPGYTFIGLLLNRLQRHGIEIPISEHDREEIDSYFTEFDEDAAQLLMPWRNACDQRTFIGALGRALALGHSEGECDSLDRVNLPIARRAVQLMREAGVEITDTEEEGTTLTST